MTWAILGTFREFMLMDSASENQMFYDSISKQIESPCIRVCHRYFKHVLWSSLKHILYRISWIFRIWPPIWPPRSHIRAQPKSFLRFFEVFWVSQSFRENVDSPFAIVNKIGCEIRLGKQQVGGPTKRQKWTFLRKNKIYSEILQKVVEIP